MNHQIYLKGQYSKPKDYREYIDIDSKNHFAKPFLKGTCISVYDVLSWLSMQRESDKVIEAYPNLTIGAIRACLDYAADRTEGEKLAS